MTTLAKGDVLGIYDYAVLVTQVSKGSSPFEGNGLVKLPFAGNITVPVEFKGIKAKKGKDGTQGGCVWYVPTDLTEGYFQVKGSQQDAIVKEQEKLLADIYSELIDPQSFYGTFEEALAKYEAKRKEIEEKEARGEVVDKKDYQELVKYLHGVVQGGSDWKAKLVDYMGGDASDPAIKEILDDFDALKKELSDCEKCLVDNLSNPVTKPGGGGPSMPDFNNLGKQPCPKPQNLKKKVKALTAKVADYTNPDDTKNFVDILKLINAVNGIKNDQTDFTTYFKLPDYLTAPLDLFGRNIENKDRYSKEYCLKNVMLEDGHKYKKLCIKNKENGGDYKTFTQYKGSLLENSDKNGFKFLKSTAIDHSPYDAYTEFGRFEITTNAKDEGDLKNYLEGKVATGYKSPVGAVDINKLSFSENGIEFLKKQEGVITHVYNDAKGGNSKYCDEHDGHTNSDWFCTESNHYNGKNKNGDPILGKPTIGLGHLIKSQEELDQYCSVKKDIQLSKEECWKLFKAVDLPKYENPLKAAIDVPLTQTQYDALVSFVFNTGTNNLRTRGVIKLINSGNFSADDMTNAFMQWKSPPIVISRREDEINLFNNGKYTFKGIKNK